MSSRCIEEKIIQTYFSKLVSAIVNPLQLADALYSQGLIDQSTRLDAAIASRNTLAKASTLLSAVERVISVSPEKFEVFLNILREQLTADTLIDQMETEYNKMSKAAPPPSKDMNPADSEGPRERRPPPTTESSDANGGDDKESKTETDSFSYWPAIKGVGSVALLSLIMWMIFIFFYTTPQVNLKNVQDRMSMGRGAGVQCHKLSNPSIAFEELKGEVSNALILGVHLGLPKVKVDIIERENRSEAEKLIEVLHLCHDFDLCSCWEDIVRAVEKYGNSRKANELEKKFIINSNEK